MPLRRHSLGFTPTGEAMPTECTDLGVRMVVEQGGYTPIGCPIAGKTDCYDIIDAVTGTVIIAKAKGKMPWIPQCGQWGYANQGDTGNCPDGQGMINGQCGKPAIACPNGDGTVTLLEITQDAQNNITGLTGKSFGVVTEEATPQNNRVFGKYSFDAAVWCKGQSIPGCADLTAEEWIAIVQEKEAAWIASGKATLDGVCAIVTASDGSNEFKQQCFYPNETAGGQSGDVESVRKTGVYPCEDTWYKNICPTLKAGELGYDKCGISPAAPPPETPAPPPGEGPIPLTIDIQAFTPGGTGPIPTQPLMQPRPAVPLAPAPKAVAPAPMPIKPVEKSLDTGSAVGIGAFLVAIGAAAFFGGK